MPPKHLLAAPSTYLIRDAIRKGRLKAEADPSSGCGLIVLGLGKLGARELNYSSDIDLVVFYEAEHAPLPEGSEPGPVFVRITQALARLLSDRTEARLCRARRSAAAARSRLDARRDLRSGGVSPTTRRSARTGNAPPS